MAQAFRDIASQRSDQEALVCGDGRATYGQLREGATDLAYGLHELGIGKGDKVAVILLPSSEFVVLFFSLAELGAVIVPINPQLRPRQLRHILQDAEPVAAVISRQFAPSPSLPQLWGRETIAGLRHVILVSGEKMGKVVNSYNRRFADQFPNLRAYEFTSLRDSPVSQSTTPLPDPSPDDLLALLYTSGTTGLPKGTMHSQWGLVAPVAASLKLRQAWLERPSLKTMGRMAKALVRYRQRLLRAAGRPQVILSTVGCHTITGLEAMLQALLMGDKLALMPHFDPLEALRLVERERVTILIGVPMAFSMMLAVQDIDRYDLSSLLICGTGGAPCPPELAREMQERFGCAVHIGFGTTELAGGIAATSLDDSGTLQAETVGQAMPGMEIRIVDEQRRELLPGQVGELACRGENVMLGYYRAPEKTAEVVDEEGWYYTGDLAVVDERGYLRIVGRKDDVIIRAGVNIYPAEIERYLEAHGKIKEAAVVGVPVPIGGERTWAFIILEKRAEMTAKEVLRHCRAELEAHKIPDQVRFVTDFPRASSGKPQKFLLREIALQEVSRK
jgi:acyl-CoA synthetase (AMP-forming)/AMP-acid ligase II